MKKKERRKKTASQKVEERKPLIYCLDCSVLYNPNRFFHGQASYIYHTMKTGHNNHQIVEPYDKAYN